MPQDGFLLEFISSKLFLGLLLLAAAAAWWFGLPWFLAAVLGWDPKAAWFVALFLRGTGTLVIGIAGLFYVASAVTE